MAYEDRTYFRNKQLAKRAKFHQKILRPLAVWLENKDPLRVLFLGFAGFSALGLFRLMVINFYGFMTVLPFLFLLTFIGLASISWALQKGKK
jgi:hypothetical protein